MIYEEITVPKVKKKRVRGLVSILLARSALTLTIAYFNIDLINDAPQRFAWWALPTYYVLGVIGVVSLVAAVSLPKYIRLGSILGIASLVADVLITALLFLSKRVISPIPLILSILLLCFFLLWLRLYLKENKTDP